MKYSRLTLEGVSLPREQSHFNVTWMRIFLTDKRDLPGIRDDNLVFLSLFFFLTFLFSIFREIFPATQKQKTSIVFFNFSRSVSRKRTSRALLEFSSRRKVSPQVFQEIEFLLRFSAILHRASFRQESELMAKLLIQRSVPLRIISSRSAKEKLVKLYFPNDRDKF